MSRLSLHAESNDLAAWSTPQIPVESWSSKVCHLIRSESSTSRFSRSRCQIGSWSIRKKFIFWTHSLPISSPTLKIPHLSSREPSGEEHVEEEIGEFIQKGHMPWCLYIGGSRPRPTSATLWSQGAETRAQITISRSEYLDCQVWPPISYKGLPNNQRRCNHV